MKRAIRKTEEGELGSLYGMLNHIRTELDDLAFGAKAKTAKKVEKVKRHIDAALEAIEDIHNDNAR